MVSLNDGQEVVYKHIFGVSDAIGGWFQLPKPWPIFPARARPEVKIARVHRLQFYGWSFTPHLPNASRRINPASQAFAYFGGGAFFDHI